MTKRSQFHVRPRYSCGSPAMVSEAIALRVAADETRAHSHALEGVYGPLLHTRATTLGLSGVICALTESGSGRNFRWQVRDLITGERTLRMSDEELRRQGFARFPNLPASVQQKIVEPGCLAADYERSFYKVSVYGAAEKYEPQSVRTGLGDY